MPPFIPLTTQEIHEQRRALSLLTKMLLVVRDTQGRNKTSCFIGMQKLKAILEEFETDD